MKHSRETAGSYAGALRPLAVLGPLAGIAACLAGALSARGGDVPFTEHVISTTADGAVSVFATDMDGDGDIDVISASQNGNKIAWYESDGGSPPTFTERVISTTAIAASSVFATDLDGDGDTDVLSASIGDDKIAWYESDGGSPPSFTERVISTTADRASSVFAMDVDGDGNIDVLSASQGDGKIAWYESDGGSPPSFTERVIFGTAHFAVSVFATDVDGDGDTDVLSASNFDDKIAWYESDGGSPPSFTERVISTTANLAFSVYATDVDGDGDIDILSASVGDGKIAWYESDDGSPPTFTEHVISTGADGAYSVFATDVDGDGDTDVLSASFNDDKIAWYENTSSPDCNENGIPDECDLDCGPQGGSCDLPGCGLSIDCNDNGTLDSCDLAAGTSTDCQGNGILDECETLPRLVSGANCVFHGEAGEFCLDLPLDDPGATEPRLGGGGKLVLVFDLPLDPTRAEDPTNIFIERCSGGVIPPEDIFPVLDDSETVLTITFDTLPGAQLADGDCYTVDVADFCLDDDANFGVTLLAGDFNGDGQVDPLDSGAVLARFGCPVGDGDPGCFTSDINNDGATDPLDSGAILARFGNSSCLCD